MLSLLTFSFLAGFIINQYVLGYYVMYFIKLALLAVLIFTVSLITIDNNEITNAGFDSLSSSDREQLIKN